jgi:hypothetical protein
VVAHQDRKKLSYSALLLAGNCLALLFCIVALSTQGWVLVTTSFVGENVHINGEMGLFENTGIEIVNSHRYTKTQSTAYLCEKPLWETVATATGSGSYHTVQIERKFHSPTGQALQIDHQMDCRHLKGTAATQIISMLIFLVAVGFGCALLPTNSGYFDRAQQQKVRIAASAATGVAGIFELTAFALMLRVRQNQQAYLDFVFEERVSASGSANLGSSFALAVVSWIISVVVSMNYCSAAWSEEASVRKGNESGVDAGTEYKPPMHGSADSLDSMIPYDQSAICRSPIVTMPPPDSPTHP